MTHGTVNAIGAIAAVFQIRELFVLLLVSTQLGQSTHFT